MRIYCALGRVTPVQSRDILDSGCRAVLVTYAHVSDPHAASIGRQTMWFWVAARMLAERERLRGRGEEGGVTRIFAAGSFAGIGGGRDPEVFLYECGVRNRLYSFAEIDDLAARQHWFWVGCSMRLYSRGMRLYFAGNVKQEGSHEADAAQGVANRLLTFADIDDWAEEAFRFWVENGPADVSVFLDSGAFGAYMRGATIDLERYCDYIREHEAALSCYAALDVIKDWRATQRNLDVMLGKGLEPIPTFHRGSPWEVLDDLARSFPYIALGGMVGGGKHDALTPESSGPYLDECFRRLRRHWPVRVHLFGVVAQWVLERYPLYSADSATAIVGAGMGRVSRFRGGALKSRPWAEDVRETLDGVVADGIGRTEGKSKSAHAGRRRRNIEAMLALERYVTDLWVSRGVVWDG